RGGDGAVTGELVFLGEAEIIALVDDIDRVAAEEDQEEPVEITADLRQERGRVGGAERDAGAADDLAAIGLDLAGVSIAGRLAPGVIGVEDVPLLAELVDQIRVQMPSPVPARSRR